MDLKLIAFVMLSTALVAVARSAEGKANDEYVKVEIKGVLQTGIIVIGGETTGYIVRVGGVVWELDFAKHPELKATADQLDKKTVVFTGDYSKKAGVEVPDRNIVSVATLAEAK